MTKIDVYDYEAEKIRVIAEKLEITIADVVEQLVELALDQVE